MATHKKTIKGLSFDTMKMGEEPVFDTDRTLTDIDLIQAYNWYNYFGDEKMAKEYLLHHCQNTKDLVSYVDCVANTPQDTISLTSGWLARIADRGGKLNIRQKTFMRVYLDNLAQNYVPSELKVTSADNATSVAQRVEERANEYIGEIEGLMDDFIRAGYKLEVDMYKRMVEIGIKGAHAKFLVKHFKPQLKELETAAKNAKRTRDEDLAEGYSTVKARELNRLIQFVQNIIDTASQIESNAKKSRKPRQRKAKPARKQIAKLKYMARFDELKLVSESPEKLVGAKAALIFNTTNNTLSLYMSENADGFTVKRSSLADYSEAKSGVKRFKKNLDLLNKFVEQTKTEAVETFRKVKGQTNPVSGRINDKMIILKVW